MLALAFLALVPALALGAAVPRAVGQGTSVLAKDALDASNPLHLSPLLAIAAATSDTAVWACGSNCDAVPSVVPVASGGDGSFVQYWYVAYSKTFNSVVVSHQGTKTANVIPLITDLNFFLTSPSNTTFPGLAKAGIQVHNGFHDQHGQTYPDILAAVKKTMSQYKTKSILLTGHSLGAALSVLDAIALQMVLPKDTQFRITTFGQPRMGNQNFADYVDAHFAAVIRMTNKDDPVPTLPGRFLGFSNFRGEVHIKSSDDSLVVCHGQDNADSSCTIGEVPTIFSGDVTLHKGPYLGVIMKCHNADGTEVHFAGDD
ncbi:lipase [Auriculariales sp. MPI-PUGE-AT-0066]|nr:lipase [Auriculariales sp. MPI-PUGE-AT-0066]